MNLRNRIKLGWASPSEEESYNGPRRNKTGEITDDHAKVEPVEWQKEERSFSHNSNS